MSFPSTWHFLSFLHAHETLPLLARTTTTDLTARILLLPSDGEEGGSFAVIVRFEMR